MTTIICDWCKQILTHQPRRIIGCNCDPDAPQWCYIDLDGTAKGLRAARYTIINKGEQNEQNQNTKET
jgi:hypothetical protein